MTAAVTSKKARSYKLAGQIILYVIAILVAIYLAFPFYWSLTTSFKTIDEIKRSTIFPTQFTIEYYKNLVTGSVQGQHIDIPWGRSFLNSVLTTFGIVLGNIFFGSLAAYAFTRMVFRGKKFLIKIFYIAMMLPGIVMLIPQVLIISRFPLAGGNNILGKGGQGLNESLWGVILPCCIGPYSMFFIRQFFLSTPNDIAEAAKIDGANHFRIFFLYARMVLPGVATLALLSFNGAWNSYLWPSIVLTEPNKLVLPVALKLYSVYFSDNFGPLMAASMVIIIPVFVLFICTQKYFTKNIAFSGIKI